MIEDPRTARAPLPATRPDPAGAKDESVPPGPAPASPRAWARSAEVALVGLLAVAAAGLSVSGNWGSEFWWNDAARHAMDGVFVHDFVRDLPKSLRLYEYATEYYARYPCLGLMHYPPVFPMVEAVFFAVWGVGMPAARAAVGAFAALGAVFGYLVARRFLGRWGAAVFVLLFITAPGVVYWSREIMLETPVMAMMLVSSYAFLRYVEDERRGAGIAAGLLLVLAVLTKQTAGCLVPVWIAYAVWRRGWRVLGRRESLIAAGLAAVLLAPFAVATVMLAPLNVGQTVGNRSGDFAHARGSLASVGFYLRELPRQVGLLTLVGIAVLFGTSLGVLLGRVLGISARPSRGEACLAPPTGVAPRGAERRRGIVYAGLWAAACYLLFTFLIANKEGRFILIWAPALAFLGASGFSLLAGGGRLARGLAAGVTLALAGQALWCGLGWRHDPWARPTPRVAGTAEAAERLAVLPRGEVVFYSGRFNGNFIFAMRRLDPLGRVVVLRDSKMLYSVPAMASHGFTAHAATREEIRNVFRDYGVRYVLVENPAASAAPEPEPVRRVTDELRALVSSDEFAVRARYAIRSSEARLARELCLYEFLGAGPARAQVLTINLPMSGRVIRVPLERLGVRTVASPGDAPRED